MNRIIALILALMLCLGLTACAVQEAEPTGQTTPQQTLPAAEPTQAPGDFLLGSWVNLSDGIMTAITFSENGVASITGEDGSRTAEYYYAGGTVSIADTMELTLRVVEEDGVTHLRRDAVSINLVREENAQMYANRVIEITMDNWQEYFELRLVTHVNVEPVGGIQYRSFGAGFLLKEEYLDQLLTDSGSLDVAVTVEYDSRCHIVDAPFTEDYVITDEINIWQPTYEDAVDIASVVDRRDPSRGLSELSDLYGQVAAYLAVDGGFEEFPRTFNYQIPERMEVIAVEGTIVLLPDL